VIKKILYYSLIAGVALLNSCSGINESATLGSDIVVSSDPTRTDFSSIFSFLDTLAIPGQASIAKTYDTVIGYGSIRAGITSNREARGWYAFQISSTYRKKHLADTIVSVQLHISTSDTAHLTDQIQVFDYYTNPLPNAAPLDSIYKFAALNYSLDTTDDSAHIYRDTLNAAGRSSINSILKDTTKKDSTTYYRLLISNKDSIILLTTTARMIIKYKTTANAFITDSITSSYCSHVIFENEALCTANNLQAITSSETGRRAVFTLDLSSLWSDMNKRTGFTTVLAATMIIEDSLLYASDTTDSTVSFRYCISSTLFTDANELRDSIVTYGISGTVTGTTKDTLHTETFLRTLTESKPQTAYLYISNISNSLENTTCEETLWRNPVITGVFTNNQ